jgi:hypothetical protein
MGLSRLLFHRIESHGISIDRYCGMETRQAIGSRRFNGSERSVRLMSSPSCTTYGQPPSGSTDALFCSLHGMISSRTLAGGGARRTEDAISWGEEGNRQTGRVLFAGYLELLPDRSTLRSRNCERAISRVLRRFFPTRDVRASPYAYGGSSINASGSLESERASIQLPERPLTRK